MNMGGLQPPQNTIGSGPPSMVAPPASSAGGTAPPWQTSSAPTSVSSVASGIYVYKKNLKDLWMVKKW